MTYKELSIVELIELAVGFIGRDQEVPKEVSDLLGPELMQDLSFPERDYAR